MSPTVCSPTGEIVQLNPRAFAQGGEATVHEVQQFPGVIVKLYHPRVRAERGDTLRKKIDAMSSDPRLAKLTQHPGLAWPRFSVFDAQKQWCGYAMRRAQGQPMTKLAHAMAYREHFPRLDRPMLVSYLLNLLGTVQQLHQAGVMVGDYNPANFLCDPGSRRVTLIDCDSWQLRAQGQQFACPVAVADMLAPELIGKTLSQVTRTIESERFSVAILLFKTLMLGRHPFDVVGGESPVENIRKGHFPYGLGGGGIPKGPWFNIWSHLPYKLKEQLVRTFKDGAHQAGERTDTAQWLDLLTVYQREMGRGWHDPTLKPQAPKSKDYKGHSTSMSAAQPA